MRKITKYLVLLASAAILTACSMQKLTDKILPEPVKIDAAKAVDAVLAKDASFFSSMRSEKMSDADFTATLDNLFSHVSEGTEIRRDIVAASSEVGASFGNGTSKAYNLIYEIQTEGGFMAITLDYVKTPAQTECCERTNITAVKSDTSPYRTTLEKFAKIMKIVGLVFLLGLGLLIFFLVRRPRRKKAH